MEAEDSSFETSEIMATFLASTPLLTDSWRLCCQANASAAVEQQSFVVAQAGRVTYVAFPGVPMVAGLEFSCQELVPLTDGLAAAAGGGVFGPLHRHGEEVGPILVHSGLLQLFLNNNHNLINEILRIMKNSKSVVFTGHFLGGTTAAFSALWLLCHLQSISSIQLSVLCITFGSPLLGNGSLSRAIVRERWGGNFCHVVTKHDIVPRLLLAPFESFTSQLLFLLQFWNISMSSPSVNQLAAEIPDEQKALLLRHVLVHIHDLAKKEEEFPGNSFWPFGNYLFYTNGGAVCVDNAMAALKLLHLLLETASPNSIFDDHLKYGEYVGNVSLQILNRKDLLEDKIPNLSYEAGITLALQSLGIASEEDVSGAARQCLTVAKRMGRRPNLPILLSKRTPLRAQIELYKAICDESDDQMGYYDSFKRRGDYPSIKNSKVNMNRMKLGQFWDEVIEMLDANQLPHDFHRRAKYVNASQFYKLLVEPLDIAEYYRTGMQRVKGHYIRNGRERRYEMFDRWWRERVVGDEENNIQRSEFAGFTQDSCFWARVEEAKEWLESLRIESDPRAKYWLWESIEKFEQYSRGMVERKEVSKDVLAKNSSYSLWVKEWGELKSQFQQLPSQFPVCDEVVL